MKPEDLKSKIMLVAEYLDKENNPSRTFTASAVRTLLLEIKTAGKIPLIDHDFHTAINMITSIIKNITKVAQTLNPQDEARVTLEQSIEGLQSTKNSLIHQFREVSSVSIANDTTTA